MIDHFRLIQDMIDAIVNDKEPVVTGEEGRHWKLSWLSIIPVRLGGRFGFLKLLSE